MTADGATPASPATPLDQVPTQPSRRSQPGRLGPAIAVTLGAALVTAGFSNGGPIAIGEAALPAEAATGALVSTGLLLVWAAFRRLTPPGTLRLARGLPTAIVLRGLLTFGFYPLDAYASLALIDWRGLPAGVAGLALAAGSLAWTVGSWTQARRAQRHDNATFIRVGFGLVTAGTLVFLVALDRAVPVAVAFAAFGIAGLGMGLAIPPQALIVLREASAEEQGVATSALALSDLLGTALGTGLAGAILAAGLRGGAATGAALAPAFVVAALSTALGVALSGRLRRPAAGAG